MFKKKIDTLLKEEIATLLENNTDLREKLEERAFDNVAFSIEDYLSGLDYKAADYSISYGYSYGDYFTIKDVDKFLEWADDVQKTYCFYSDDDWKTIKELEKINETYKHCFELWNYGYSCYTGKYGLIADDDFYNVEKKYTELKDNAEALTFDRLRAEFDYYTEYRSGDDLRAYLIGLWYDFYDLVFDDCKNGFADHALTHIYEGEPGHYTPAQIVNIRLSQRIRSRFPFKRLRRST